MRSELTKRKEAERPFSTAVIVVAHDGLEYTKECLAALTRQTIRHDVILVDNGSSSGFIEAITCDFPSVHAIRLERNLGFSGGANAGMRLALTRRYEYIALINNDAAPNSDWLAKMVCRMKDDPQIGIVGGRILTRDGRLIEFDGDVFHRETASGGYSDAPVGNSRIESKYIPYACGASMLIRSAVLRKIGLFPDYFVNYNEDIDLSLRAWTAGYTVVLEPQAVVRHRRGMTAGKMGKAYRDELGMRNALSTALRVYEWTTLAGFLPAVLRIYLFSFRRHLLKAFYANLRIFRRLMRDRRAIQAMRKRPDSAVFAHFDR